MKILIILWTINLVIGLGIIIHELFFDKEGLTLAILFGVICAISVPVLGIALLLVLIDDILDYSYNSSFEKQFKKLKPFFNKPISFRKK